MVSAGRGVSAFASIGVVVRFSLLFARFFLYISRNPLRVYLTHNLVIVTVGLVEVTLVGPWHTNPVETNASMWREIIGIVSVFFIIITA